MELKGLNMARMVEELANGVRVYQVTDEPGVKDNIYCEGSFCTPDSSWFIFKRRVGPSDVTAWHFTAEYVACEFGTWRTRVLGRGLAFPAISSGGWMYHEREATGGLRELVRVDVATGASEEIWVNGGVRPFTGMTVSPDERRITYGVALGYDPQMFGVEVVELASGERRVVCEDRDICNPHTQFNQRDGGQILVQKNRGCQFSPDGEMLSLLGSEGCTLFEVGVDDGRMTPLAVGPPNTTTCTGHQQWIGQSDEVLLTIAEHDRSGDMDGNLLVVRAGEAARQAARGMGFTHVHASLCGRYFVTNRMATGEVMLGSIETGRWEVLLNSGAATAELYAQFDQASHAHGYLSPDLKWVVLNSCRTGRPEIHVASVPGEMLARLGS